MSVAMGNASEKVKNLAKAVTETNENDGVAVLLAQFQRRFVGYFAQIVAVRVSVWAAACRLFGAYIDFAIFAY